MSCYVQALSRSSYSYTANQEVKKSLFEQYEHTIMETLLTSFGLDFIVKDRHGGDVDTVYNVRQIESDPQMVYKSPKNAKAWENNGSYNSPEYHHHKDYIKRNKEISAQRKEGHLQDPYTGNPIPSKEHTDLDHVISAREIHDDRGRVLSGWKGSDLANSPENLVPTNPHLNRSKKADSMSVFLEKHDGEYTDDQKERMKQIDKTARQVYEQKIHVAYYSSPQFRSDLASAAIDTGVKMGIRQATGLFFAEIWFSVKDEWNAMGGDFTFEKALQSVGSGINNGVNNAKNKFGTLLSKFLEGSIAGAFSSLTTTLINIFATTAKNTVRIIRQCWASLVHAFKVLFFNPDHLPLGERLLATTKILATAASTIVGILVSEAVEKCGLSTIPVVGSIIPDFCGAFVTGIMSCTLLYVLDNSSKIKNFVEFINEHSLHQIFNNYIEFSDYLDKYAAELMKIDIKIFKKEYSSYIELSNNLNNAKNTQELNTILLKYFKESESHLPWTGDFKSFMANRKNRVVFK